MAVFSIAFEYARLPVYRTNCLVCHKFLEAAVPARIEIWILYIAIITAIIDAIPEAIRGVVTITKTAAS